MMERKLTFFATFAFIALKTISIGLAIGDIKEAMSPKLMCTLWTFGTFPPIKLITALRSAKRNKREEENKFYKLH